MEGPVVVREALAAGLAIKDVFVAEGSHQADDIRRLCEGAGIVPLEVGDGVLRALADTASPQGVVAIAATPGFSLGEIPAGADLVLVLADVRDPGNAGTLVRTAAALGAACAVFPKGAADPFAPKTVRASAGTVLRLPIVRSIELAEALIGLREQGFEVVAADAAGATPVYELDLRGKIAVLLGNEAWGLDPAIGALVDRTASIPMPGAVESLNVATAGAIFLSEAWRQRRLSSAPHG